ncbi:MAG: hypothetical protein KHX56_11970, partial [Clostridiales bacterium]|nr:hypothetical protein [Clostridiales bacterium]
DKQMEEVKPDMTAILCLNMKAMAQNRQPRLWRNISLWSAGFWEFKRRCFCSTSGFTGQL